MSCVHLRQQITRAQGIGGDAHQEAVTLCKLKEQSTNAAAIMSQRLLELGFGGSIVSTVCPVAARNAWEKCPWFEAA